MSAICTALLLTAMRLSVVFDPFESFSSGFLRRASTKVAGAPWIATLRKASPSRRKRLPSLASQMQVAFSSIASKTGFKSPGDELMTLRTSEAAESCSNASSRSRLNSATFVSLSAAEELRRTLAFGALRRFSVTILRCRVLTGSPPALERRLIDIEARPADVRFFNLVHVPYRGAGPALVDLLGGQVQVMFASMSSSIEYVRAGKLRALAVTTATRSPVLPDIPTVAEFVPGYEASFWTGIGAPKNTRAEIVDTLNEEINAVLADAKMKARLAELGVTGLPGSPADFNKLIADETEKWGKVVRAAGIKAE